MTKRLLSFGHGYSARALAAELLEHGWTIYGTTRDAEKAEALAEEGVQPIIWGQGDIEPILAKSTHILISAGPDEAGDPVLNTYGDLIRDYAAQLDWAGYLSTTGVYGDHGGGWVDEETPLAPSTRRGEMRQGTARRIIKPGQVFSRIHVEDIAQVLAASIARPDPGAVYNLCDDDPAPPEEVIAYAAELLGLPVPEAVDFDAAEMTPMARSFYAESKRVRNDRIKEALGVTLRYPDYRAGLQALAAAEKPEV